MSIKEDKIEVVCPTKGCPGMIKVDSTIEKLTKAENADIAAGEGYQLFDMVHKDGTCPVCSEICNVSLKAYVEVTPRSKVSLSMT